MIALSTFLHVGILIAALAIELSPKVQTGILSKCALFGIAVFSLAHINQPPSIEGIFLMSVLLALLLRVLHESFYGDGRRLQSFNRDSYKTAGSHKKDATRFTRYG